MKQKYIQLYVTFFKTWRNYSQYCGVKKTSTTVYMLFLMTDGGKWFRLFLCEKLIALSES